MKHRSLKGASMNSQLGNAWMTGPLFRMVITQPPEPRKAKKEAKRKGKTTIPDETVLEMRRLHEIERLPSSEIVTRYPDISAMYVRRLLQYECRAHLTLPKKTPL